jgi:hypothetical protein
MVQLHKRFSDEQIVFLLEAFEQRLMSREEIQETLDISRSRFYVLWKEYQKDPEGFSISYQRTTPKRLSPETEDAIENGLNREKALIEDPEIPISGYNYSALRDRLRKDGMEISVNTIIDRAKKMGCHKPRKKKKVHDREVLTASIGALVQHDGSTHRWSPFAEEKWTLISSIDDYSRLLLFADFFPGESTWAHIQAARAVIETFGVALRYYVDSLRVFRFVQGRDSIWRKHVLQTDDINTQWGQMMNVLGIQVVYALSPQAKGKVERPYRWLQDRIIRTCALENIGKLEEARAVLQDELDRYNNHQVHSTTGEIPRIRFEKAIAEGNTLFRSFSLPRPYTSMDDVFCLRETRMVNAYRRISLHGHEIQVPNMPLREHVDVHMIPDTEKNTMQVRIWWKAALVHSLALPLEGFRVHF